MLDGDGVVVPHVPQVVGRDPAVHQQRGRDLSVHWLGVMHAQGGVGLGLSGVRVVAIEIELHPGDVLRVQPPDLQVPEDLLDRRVPEVLLVNLPERLHGLSSREHDLRRPAGVVLNELGDVVNLVPAYHPDPLLEGVVPLHLPPGEHGKVPPGSGGDRFRVHNAGLRVPLRREGQGRRPKQQGSGRARPREERSLPGVPELLGAHPPPSESLRPPRAVQPPTRRGHKPDALLESSRDEDTSPTSAKTTSPRRHHCPIVLVLVLVLVQSVSVPQGRKQAKAQVPCSQGGSDQG
mmetsp:Transcript_12388/g.34487  ORF Transcript_12388/g.34487 Transcript_12388/m.34487 type:complete len:292 (+) Transcript_12388:2341-3216(+)